MWLHRLSIQKFVELKHRKHEDTLVLEKPFSLFVNDCLVFQTFYTPGREKEMAVGYLLAKGVITSVADVAEITVTPGEVRVACSCVEAKISLEEPLKELVSVKLVHIYTLTASFQEKALLFKDTAISESAALFIADKIVAFAEDLSSENAFFKALGIAALQGEGLTHCGVLTSSKMDQLFVAKLVGLGLSLAISRTAPTHAAVQLANEKDVLLIGFARGRKCNVYGPIRRIIQ